MKRIVIAGAFLLCISSCESEQHDREIQETILNIEKSLGFNSSEKKPIVDRLKSIENVLSQEKQVIYVLPKHGFDIEHGDTYEATVLIRKFNPLDQRSAAVVINDSVMPLKYDSLQKGHVIKFKPNKLGENNCNGMVTYNNGQDTMNFLCDFTVQQANP